MRRASDRWLRVVCLLDGCQILCLLFDAGLGALGWGFLGVLSRSLRYRAAG